MYHKGVMIHFYFHTVILHIAILHIAILHTCYCYNVCLLYLASEVSNVDTNATNGQNL